MKQNVWRRYGVSALAGLLLSGAGHAVAAEEAAPAAPAVEQSNPWEFNVATYVWGSKIKGETRAGDNIDVGFSDILDKLKFAGMGLASARKGRWVVFGDVIYLKLEDDLHAGVATGDLTMDTWITQAAVGYTVYENDRFTVDVFGGARYLSLEIDMDPAVFGIPLPFSLNASEDIWNGITGVKGAVKLPKQWFGTYYFDVGTGDTELTYQAMGTVGYRFEKWSVVAGYRYLRYNFDTSDTAGKILNHLELQGPIAGVMYSF